MKTTIRTTQHSAGSFMRWLGEARGTSRIGGKLLHGRHFIISTVFLAAGLGCLLSTFSSLAYEEMLNVGDDHSRLMTEHASLWESDTGEGFKAGTETFNVSLAGGFGVASFGSVQRHDLAWASVAYGRMLGGVRGKGRWYQGNFELLGELFGGSQYSPASDWLVGFTPHVRYHFATGTRLVPFVDGGAGVLGTGIHLPDLSTRFEFNTQGGGGVDWFFKDDIALTVQARFVHISNAGISRPNHGVNTVMGILGVTWFF